jgi:hypothetical protein
MIETVNGYICHNCSDVALAKRNIDPAHPKDGPNGVDAKDEAGASKRGDAVTFGGALDGAQTAGQSISSVSAPETANAAVAAAQDGTSPRVDLRV